MKSLLFITLMVLLSSCSHRSHSNNDDNNKGFLYDPAGKLTPSNSGTGRVGDRYIYAPGIRFPIESYPAYINSQVYGIGGLHGKPGSLCDGRNYQYPWHDNFCEKRGWNMPLCPGGKGHQGVDIRAKDCADKKHAAVATEDGTITAIGRYTVYLRSKTGRTYRYLHLDSRTLQVSRGQKVKRGQRIGYISNNMGTAKTSIHLHFDIKQTIRFGDGRSASVYVPPYASLVKAYERQLRGNP